jgi:hypothetical protein
MHLLLAGSALATVSAWAVMPAADVFDTGLAGHFASAMQQASEDCPATSMFVDGGSMLVLLDERGGVTEVELGAMPRQAERELRMAMPGVFAGAMTAITPDALVCAAIGAEEEEEVQAQVEVSNGGGTIIIEHNGERREVDIDLGDLDFDVITEEMGEAGIDMRALMGRLMSGDMRPEVHAEVVVEMVDEDGEHHRRHVHRGGNEDGPHDEQMMMRFMARQDGQWMPGRDPHGGPGMGQQGMGAGNRCPMCSGGGPRKMGGPRGMGGPRKMGGHGGGMGSEGMHGPQGMMPPHGMMGRGMGAGHGEGSEHHGMHGHHGRGAGHGDMAADMLREHMHFLREMHEDPEQAWEIIESLPPEMRREHEELLGQLMGGHDGDHDDHEFFARVQQFDEKIAVAGQVAHRLNDSEALAVFGVWQAREHMDLETRIGLLAPMVSNEGLRTSVRNAAAFVVMEALGELDDKAGAAAALREMILRNGSTE